MNISNLSPVVLFVYNRPDHAENALMTLRANDYAEDSTLYIFSDGPKLNATDEQKRDIEETRKVIRKEKWCKEVIIIESDKNKGLANSIINGVTDVIAKHGKVIVLEDDLLTSPYFLKFMNEALSYYEDKKAVFSISADRPPAKKLILPENYQYDVFVSLRNFSTGWATWNDRWSLVDWEMKKLDAFLSNSEQVRAFNRGGEDLTKMLIMQRNREIDSWSIVFTFAHFAHHAVSILPNNPYVDNIGFDGSGVHSLVTVSQRKDITKAVENARFIDIIYEDRRIINAFYSYYHPAKRPLWQKMCNRLSRIFLGRNVFIIKKKVFA